MTTPSLRQEDKDPTLAACIAGNPMRARYSHAFKVPDEVRQALLQSGRATQLRHFPNAPIKQDYVLFDWDTAVSASDAALLILGYDPTPK